MPVKWQVPAIAWGSSAMKRPVPQPGSRTRPPAKPKPVTALQRAWTRIFRCEMGILGRAGQPCQLRA